jgi:hypothetical protein
LLSVWSELPAERSAVDLSTVVQQGRGASLSDKATLLVLVWLFLVGVLGPTFQLFDENLRLVAPAWLIGIAVLGFMRVTLNPSRAPAMYRTQPHYRSNASLSPHARTARKIRDRDD